EFDRFLQYYANSADLNIRKEKEKDGKTRRAEKFEKNKSGGQQGYQRLFVNLGTKDGFYKASFLQFILDMSDLKKDVLGRIDMKEMNSWIEIERTAGKKMIDAIDGKKYRGRKIRMNDAETGGKKKKKKKAN
ncbi:MAG: DbpA RNA binding domain-containing protein, partial [Chitinophagaceae bacterium]